MLLRQVHPDKKQFLSVVADRALRQMQKTQFYMESFQREEVSNIDMRLIKRARRMRGQLAEEKTENITVDQLRQLDSNILS